MPTYVEAYVQFLSTPSARRATSRPDVAVDEVVISIHALREEGDNQPGAGRRGDRQFLSTPSARRATGQRTRASLERRFLSTPSARRATSCRGNSPATRTRFLSTPSARRATSPSQDRRGTTQNFYPRPPRGGRPSTSRRAAQPQPISIHALREEGDFDDPEKYPDIPEFLSTPSARRATSHPNEPNPPDGVFLSTPSARRATC